MHVKLILPSLAEARGEFWRPIKYSLFPPLGLVTLASYLPDDWEVSIEDEHVETLHLDDSPDLVGIQVYVTSARRAYEIADAYQARGVYVVMGGLHVTSLPEEALAHADTVVLGPAEEAWPRFLRDWRQGRPRQRYRSESRTLEHMPPIRRALIKRHLYMVPNSIVVSRGCPHDCDFCYKTSFFQRGRSHYTYAVDQALTEIDALPSRHVFFLDDNLLAAPEFARGLFSGMGGMGRVWQAAATVQSLRDATLVDAAARSGLRSLFIGFETLNQEALLAHNKRHNRQEEYAEVIRRLRDHGVMINGSFVFGMDQDDASVFEATAEWAIQNGLETATFHILTPYPGTPLYQRLSAEGRISHRDWDRYDTRHAVFRHPRMSAQAIEEGYWRAYELVYRWSSIFRSAASKPNLAKRARHIAYSGAWKKLDPLWSLLISLRRLDLALPGLESVLEG